MDGYTVVLLHLDGPEAGKAGFFVFEDEKEYRDFIQEKKDFFGLLETPTMRDFLYFADAFSPTRWKKGI